MLGQIEKRFDQIISWLLFSCLMGMLSLSVLSVFMRWLQTGLPWIDPLVRHLVFFGGFLGGILATGKGTHIGIDVTTKLMESKGFHKLAKNTHLIIYVASGLVCSWLAYSSYLFYLMEREYPKEVFLGIHNDKIIFLIPIGFGLIAFRYLLKLVSSLVH